jgi:hypothetical protein
MALEINILLSWNRLTANIFLALDEKAWQQESLFSPRKSREQAEVE